MKYRLPALIAVAAVLVAPGIASAAPARDDMFANTMASSIADGPTVTTIRDDNAVMESVNAEHPYLASVCPSVLRHPGENNATLVRFCQEAKG